MTFPASMDRIVSQEMVPSSAVCYGMISTVGYSPLYRVYWVEGRRVVLRDRNDVLH